MQIPDWIVIEAQTGRLSQQACVWLSLNPQTWPWLWGCLRFDLSRYLPAGEYDHFAIRRAYFRAVDERLGTEFRIALAEWEVTGRLFMPHYDDGGEDKSFFEVAACAKRSDPPIPGVVIVEGE